MSKAMILVASLILVPSQAHVVKPKLVQRIATAIRKGVELDPVLVRQDAEGLWLLDGFHRVAAAERVGLETVPAVVIK